jgi:acyl carrier protein
MLEKLTTIIQEYKADKSIVVTVNTVIKEDLDMTSFDLIQLACAVEDEFDIEIPDRAIKDFKTIADVIAFIEEQ